MVFGVRLVLLFLMLTGSFALLSHPLIENAKLFDRFIRSAIGRRVYDYIGYGNYCGMGGEGPVMDPIDMCCKEHDDCFDEAEMLYGCNYVRTSYDVAVRDDTGEKICEINPSLCQREICQCNMDLIKCTISNDIFYNRANLNLHRALRSIGRSIEAVIQ